MIVLISLCNYPYVASKYANEIIASIFARLYPISVIGLRFFTVYGPRGRPDMSPYKFVDAIHNGEPITVYGDGEYMRDFTYIDDIVNGIMACVDIDKKDIAYNLGNNNPVSI